MGLGYWRFALILFVTLSLSCGSNGNGQDPTVSPDKSASPDKRSNGSPALTTHIEADNATEQGATEQGATEQGAANAERRPSVPTYEEGPLLLVEIDKWGARVSGGTWFKSQSAQIRKQHADTFKPKVVSAFRRLSPLKATGRTVGRSLFYPAVVGLGNLLSVRAQIAGSEGPVPVELRVGKGVPFWLVSHFANFLLWNDGVSHLQVRQTKRTPGMVIARALGPAKHAEASCAQLNVLLRANKALTYWEHARHGGLAPPAGLPASVDWTGPPDDCTGWKSLKAELLRASPPPGAGVEACPTVRVEALDGSLDWESAAPAIARSLPAGYAILLGNVNRPDGCPD